MEPLMLRADARASRERILVAAHEVLRERGIDAEVKEFAERAGVGIGTLYRHFPTKDDLIVGIAGEMFSVIRQIVDEALAIDDPIAAVRHLLHHGLETVDRYGDLVEVLHRGVLPKLKEQFDLGGLLASVVAIVQKGIEAGIFFADLDAELAATVLVSSLHPEMLQQLRRTRSLDQIVERHLLMFLRGVCRDVAGLSAPGTLSHP